MEQHRASEDPQTGKMLNLNARVQKCNPVPQQFNSGKEYLNVKDWAKEMKIDQSYQRRKSTGSKEAAIYFPAEMYFSAKKESMIMNPIWC